MGECAGELKMTLLLGTHVMEFCVILWFYNNVQTGVSVSDDDRRLTCDSSLSKEQT